MLGHVGGRGVECDCVPAPPCVIGIGFGKVLAMLDALVAIWWVVHIFVFDRFVVRIAFSLFEEVQRRFVYHSRAFVRLHRWLREGGQDD